MTNHEPGHRDRPLGRLRDSHLMFAEAKQDIRGFGVIDRHGRHIGIVSRLFIDEAARKVQLMEIRFGGILGVGDRHVLLPVDVITRVAGREVHVNQNGERIAASSPYDPSLVRKQNAEYQWALYEIYGYWGGIPYFPDLPLLADDDDEDVGTGVDAAAVSAGVDLAR